MIPPVFHRWKTQLFALLCSVAATAGSLFAADDPYAAIGAALARNQLDAAESALAPLVATAQPDPRALLFQSQVRARQNRAAEAVEWAEKAVAAAPGNARLHANLGSALGQRIGEVNFFQQGVLARRLRLAFEKSVELDPNLVDGYIGLARFYTNAPLIAGGGREPAERYAQELAKRNPQLGMIELARIAERFKDFAAAAVHYTQAAAAQPDSAALQESLGRVHEALEQPQQARRFYAAALALEPGRATAQAALTRLDAGSR